MKSLLAVFNREPPKRASKPAESLCNIGIDTDG